MPLASLSVSISFSLYKYASCAWHENCFLINILLISMSYANLPSPSAPADPLAPLNYERLATADERMQKFARLAGQYEISQTFASRLRQLEGFEIVFICDDSGSMGTTVGQLLTILYFIVIFFSLQVKRTAPLVFEQRAGMSWSRSFRSRWTSPLSSTPMGSISIFSIVLHCYVSKTPTNFFLPSPIHRTA